MSPLYVDGWKLMETDRLEAGAIVNASEEKYIGDVQMEEKQGEKHLGQVVADNGSNQPHIKYKHTSHTSSTKNTLATHQVQQTH